MNKSPNIRIATNADKNQLIPLFIEHAAFENTKLADNQTAIENSDLKDIPATIFVVEIDNIIQGYLSITKQFSTWEFQYYVYVDCLYLKKELRGLGLGKKLMDIACDWGKSRGINQLQLQTPSSNENAIAFYQNYGAVKKSKQRFFLPIT